MLVILVNASKILGVLDKIIIYFDLISYKDMMKRSFTQMKIL